MDSKGFDDDPPSAKSLDEGYNQTYVIMDQNTQDPDMKASDGTEVFFRCGNWCYKGQIQFAGLKMGTEDLPVIIPTLQRQQGSLRYYCNAKSIPPESSYADPVAFLNSANEFIAQELVSESVEKELKKMATIFSWIDDDAALTYFELSCGNTPEYMDKISLIAMQGGEGDQALLDVRFPDVSKHGQGIHLNTYNDHTVSWRKLVLWHVLDSGASAAIKRELPKIKTVNVANKNYEQTYCIMKSSFDANSPTLSVHHDVLFRFGSWCYSGRVQLTPSLHLSDVPYVIPALRMQQSRLDYLCDVGSVPTTSPFAAALEYVQYIAPRIEEEIVNSEEVLHSLIDRLSNMGLGESVTRWLEGDPVNSFFEFRIQPDVELQRTFKDVEMVVSKCYYASGIIVITILFQASIYVTVLENTGESPLLDSRFPDVSGKGRGYQVQVYNDGSPNWPALRKVSIWQTVGALEQEFRERASQLAQAKKQELEKSKAEESGKGLDKDVSITVETSQNDEKLVEPETEVPSKAEEKSVSISESSIPSKADFNSNAVAEASTESVQAKASLAPARNRPLQSLPHHVPKVESLSKRLDEIRKNMGEEGMKAPWDVKGRPLGAIGTTSDSAAAKK